MLEIIADIVKLDPVLIGKIIMVMVIVNAALYGAKVFLEKIKDMTTTDLDNKAYDIVAKLSDFASIAIDWISANRAHIEKK